jgi:hypothetical protein
MGYLSGCGYDRSSVAEKNEGSLMRPHEPTEIAGATHRHDSASPPRLAADAVRAADLDTASAMLSPLDMSRHDSATVAHPMNDSIDMTGAGLSDSPAPDVMRAGPSQAARAQSVPGVRPACADR